MCKEFIFPFLYIYIKYLLSNNIRQKKIFFMKCYSGHSIAAFDSNLFFIEYEERTFNNYLNAIFINQLLILIVHFYSCRSSPNLFCSKLISEYFIPYLYQMLHYSFLGLNIFSAMNLAGNCPIDELKIVLLFSHSMCACTLNHNIGRTYAYVPYYLNHNPC